MATARKTPTKATAPALKHHIITPQNNDGNIYVNTSCNTDLYNALVVYASDNGLGSPQDVLRVAATRFLKSAGYLPK